MLKSFSHTLQSLRICKFAAFLTALWCGAVLSLAQEKTAAETPAKPQPKVSNLPIVLIESKSPIVSEPKVPFTFQLLVPGNSVEKDVAALTGSIRIHGGTSQAYAKKSYGISLEKPVRLLDMREHTHWVLNAAYIDRSLMRHKLSYDLFRSISVKEAKRYAVASRFVEVYLNGRYNGVYLLMERIDDQLMNLTRFRSNDVSHAVIYKAVDHAANFARPGHAGYEQREPDPLQHGPYWQALDEFNQFVVQTPEESFFDDKAGIRSKLDLDNAIDFHLLVLLTSNGDGITKNFIFARERLDPAKAAPRFFFAPWDYDATFGRNWNAHRVEPTAWLSNNLFKRLMKNPEYHDRFAARWKRLREKQFSLAAVQALIDANVRELGEAAARNAKRWPTERGPYPDALTFAEDVAEMKSWIEVRLKWLDGEILEGGKK